MNSQNNFTVPFGMTLKTHYEIVERIKTTKTSFWFTTRSKKNLIKMKGILLIVDLFHC